MNTRNALESVLDHYRNGRVREGDAACLAVLQGAALEAPLMLALGMIALQAGSRGMAIELLGRVVAVMPDHADAHYQLGVILHMQGRLDEAIACYRQSIALAPDAPATHGNLGVALESQGRFEEAAQSLRRALAIDPRHAEAHFNLGNTLKAQGQSDEAIACYRRAIELRADFVDALDNLGVALQEKGRLDEAVACYRHALALHPDWPATLANLGVALREQGKVDEAIATCLRAVQLGETSGTRIAFAQAIRHAAPHPLALENAGPRELVRRAVDEAWVRPADLLLAALSLVKLNPAIGDTFDRAARAWPRNLDRERLFGSAGFSAVANDALLRALLENMQASNAMLERFLTMARAVLLAEATNASTDMAANAALPLPFWCALARQCFINGFVFAEGETEGLHATALRDELVAMLAARAPVPHLKLIAVAAYFPLHGIPGMSSLLAQQWPACIDTLLTQQVREPALERAIAPNMARATPIAGEVSQRVRQQYEENPYPRWVKIPAVGKPVLLAAYLNGEFPFATIEPTRTDAPLEILIAGCGTGQHSNHTAGEFRNARVRAVDLSLASLCYARRKSEELGVANIEYAQADIMELDTAWVPAGRRFDLIESVGVLHHLADPVAGWRALLSLLKPRGFMRLGFYSERARLAVVAAREYIAARGYGSSTDEIRRCRQEIMAKVAEDGESSPYARLLHFSDFYGASECRDLLFHVQEHRYQLPQLKRILDELNLDFIGFALDPDIRRQYDALYPGDPARANLDNWHTLEMQYPDTFAAMYQFWVRKRD